jgi:hypothetical protein
MLTCIKMELQLEGEHVKMGEFGIVGSGKIWCASPIGACLTS